MRSSDDFKVFTSAPLCQALFLEIFGSGFAERPEAGGKRTGRSLKRHREPGCDRLRGRSQPAPRIRRAGRTSRGLARHRRSSFAKLERPFAGWLAGVPSHERLRRGTSVHSPFLNASRQGKAQRLQGPRGESSIRATDRTRSSRSRASRGCARHRSSGDREGASAGC